VLFPQLQLPTDVPLKLTFDLNDRVMVVGLVVAAISAVGSSLVPAWKSTRTDLVSHLRSQAGDTPRRSRLWGRNILVCGQVALSLVLLTVAVFLFRAYQSEYGRGPGFRTDHVLLMSRNRILRYEPPRVDRFYDELRDRASAIPGVVRGATSSVPFDGISIENTAVAQGFRSARDGVCARSARIDEGLSTRSAFASSMAGRFGRPMVRTRLASPSSTKRSRRDWQAGTRSAGFRLINGWHHHMGRIVGVAMDARYRNISRVPPSSSTTRAADLGARRHDPAHTSGDPLFCGAAARAVPRSIPTCRSSA
jgi:hypothetical protein